MGTWVVLFLFIAGAAGVFLITKNEAVDTAEDTDDYDAISSVVWRELDRIVSSLAGDEELGRAICRLDEIHIWAERLPKSSSRRAYLYWIPYFRKKALRYKDHNAHSRAIDAVKSKVLRPPPGGKV